MKTVSTLCATSTVGIAACGYALARPCTGNDLNDHLTNATIHSNNFLPSLIRKPAGPNGDCLKSVDNSNQQQHQFTNLSRLSTSRKWLRRLSISFSSSSSSGSSPTTSTVSSSLSSPRSRSQSASLDASAPNSRPPTRSRLLKRSPSQRFAGSPTLPSHVRRPSTAVIQSAPARKSSHLTPIHASRPSTSAPESNPSRLSSQEPQRSWRVFFSAKRQKARSSSAAGGKLTKFAGIRRIYPSQSRQDPPTPTLVLAPSLETSDNDTASIFSGAASLLFDSRPATRMDDFPRSRGRPSTSANIPAPKRLLRRSFSVSNILPIAGARMSGQDDKGVSVQGDDGDALVGLYSADLSVSRRFSEPLSHSPFSLRPGSVSPPMFGEDGGSLPPIQSLSALELDMDALPATNTAADVDDYHLETLSPVDPTYEAGTDDDREDMDSQPFSQDGGGHRHHRLSVISASERASTLVGSEDLGHFEAEDLQSETVFDSVRTRVSEPTPVRLDAIFPEPGEYHLPMGSVKSFVGSDLTPTKGGNPPPCSTPTGPTPHFQRSNMFDDDDSSSDWDLPSRSVDDAGELRVPTSSGLRPHNGLHLSSRLGLNLNNASNTSFGTALEGLSIDGSSIRETSSILEWSESVPNNGTPPSLSRRSMTIHAKESLLPGNRAGRRAPSFHIRSQSVPIASTVRNVPSPSENWDDDFLDNDDDGSGFGLTRSEMIIPKEIEERQASVIGHLSCVREFALLVEDLKRLREIGIATGLRNGAHRHLWEEADGIITLATLGDLDTIPSVQPEKGQNRSSWHTPSRHSDVTAEEDFNKSTPRNRRRSSILLPDDDVFGGGNLPATPSSFPHLRHGFRSPSASSSASPLSKRSVGGSDSVEAAKGIMERMRLQHLKTMDHSMVSGKSMHAWDDGMFQFDTDMLKGLVVHVGRLKRDLDDLVSSLDSPSAKRCYTTTTDVVDSPTTMEPGEHGPEVGAGVSAFDQESCGSGLERVGSNNGVDFRPIVGVV